MKNIFSGTRIRYNKLFLTTINTSMIWGITKGRPKHNKESALALDLPVMEPEIVFEELPFEDKFNAISNRILLIQVRNTAIEIGITILKLAYVSDNSWGTINHAGFRLFSSLGFDRALEM